MRVMICTPSGRDYGISFDFHRSCHVCYSVLLNNRRIFLFMFRFFLRPMDFPENKRKNSENKQDIPSSRNVDEDSKQEERRDAADSEFDCTHSAMDSPQHGRKIVYQRLAAALIAVDSNTCHYSMAIERHFFVSDLCRGSARRRL